MANLAKGSMLEASVDDSVSTSMDPFGFLLPISISHVIVDITMIGVLLFAAFTLLFVLLGFLSPLIII